MNPNHLRILSEVLLKYHQQAMSIEEQIKRIEIAESEGSQILIGHGSLLAALEMLQGEMEKDKWISVDERLPEENTPAIFYSKSGQTTILMYTESSAVWYEWRFSHWQPLPEPPTKK